MSIFERLKNIVKANKNSDQPVNKVTTLYDLRVGNIISLDMEDWLIEGVVRYQQEPRRVVFWIKTGMQRQAVLIDQSVSEKAVVLTPFAGRLDNMDEVKTEYILDNKSYYLDHKGERNVSIEGDVPVGTGEVMFWFYETDQGEIFFIEWQAGRFYYYDGRWINRFEIGVVA